jgi:prevent-host-death family protein
MCYMMSVGIRELRQNLSVYIRRVQRGEALRVTEHGKPVALLTPLPPDEDPLADMEAAGKLIPAQKPWSELPPPIKMPPGSPSVTEILLAMRDEDER